MNKYLILLAVFFGGLSYAQNRAGVMSEQALDMAQNSFYTGCMGGIIAVIETGLFKGGKDAKESNKNFANLKMHCIKQSFEYRKFLE